MYECFHCGQKAVIWDCFDGDGIVQVCHCTNCGAESVSTTKVHWSIEYYISMNHKEAHDVDSAS